MNKIEAFYVHKFTSSQQNFIFLLGIENFYWP